ncbi:hypothetical protein [Methylobacillus sp.]|uniref:hypothetical protein n=1 Tax=Methylobacillus sp. TaxID=56818 RepID=UPI0012C73412|nr:hypothetical protein [Methylobacillus sp.]MPS48471.1 hypothetical protein [Methylobacillus sp.]
MAKPVACYGVPSVFNFKSQFCINCEHFTGCQHASYQELNAYRTFPIATAALVQHEEYRARNGLSKPADTVVLDNNFAVPEQRSGKRRYALTAEQAERVKALPKKVGAFLEKFWSRGMHHGMMEDISNGKNPFNSKSQRGYHAAWELLARGRVHRASMVSSLTEMLGWTEDSAYTQVYLIWQIFPELGIASADGAFLKPIQVNG